MTNQNENPTIAIRFLGANSTDYELHISPNVSVEQIALLASRLRFIANYAWTASENERALRALQEQEDKMKIARVKPEFNLKT